MQDGDRVGWDLAGVVERGLGRRPLRRPAGTRVVGFMPTNAWAELVAVPSNMLAPLRDDVTFEQAATLPVAGLTALRALDIIGPLIARRALVTGASGGVGRFAVQLAKMAGAHVTAVSASPERAKGLRELGADAIIHELEPTGDEFDGIVEGVGGASLGAAIQRVAAQGTIVSFASSDPAPVEYPSRALFGRASGAKLVGIFVFAEVQSKGGCRTDLGRLVRLVGEGRLDCSIDRVMPWSEAATAVGRAARPQDLRQGRADGRLRRPDDSARLAPCDDRPDRRRTHGPHPRAGARPLAARAPRRRLRPRPRRRRGRCACRRNGAPRRRRRARRPLDRRRADRRPHPAARSARRAALVAGKHVLCEKPLTLDVRRDHELGRLAESLGLVLQVGFWRRFAWPYREAARLLADGAIGTPRLVRLSQWDSEPPPPAFCDPAVSGGIEIDCGVHELDLAAWLLGSPIAHVSAAGTPGDPAIEAVGDVETLVALAVTAGGAPATIDLARSVRYGDDVRSEIVGARGALLISADRHGLAARGRQHAGSPRSPSRATTSSTTRSRPRPTASHARSRGHRDPDLPGSAASAHALAAAQAMRRARLSGAGRARVGEGSS